MLTGSDSKRETLLATAATVFRRHGYRRTSMDDIVRQTGVSHPSLYSRIANRDEVFGNLSIAVYEDALGIAESFLKEQGDRAPLEERLEGALAAEIGGTLTFGDQSPHGNEICDEAHRLSGDIVFAAAKRFQELLTTALRSAARDGEIQLERSGSSAKAAAEMLRSGAYGLTRRAPDSAAFDGRLGGFVRIFVDRLR